MQHAYLRQPASPRQAFTLVELLVVCAIVLLLSALGASAYLSANRASIRLDCANRLRQVSIVLAAYGNDFRDRLPEAVPPVGFGDLANWADLWAHTDPDGLFFSTAWSGGMQEGNRTLFPRLPRMLERYLDGDPMMLHCNDRGLDGRWPSLGPYYYHTTRPWGTTQWVAGGSRIDCGVWKPFVPTYESPAHTALVACQNPAAAQADPDRYGWRHGEKDRSDGGINNHLYLDGSVRDHAAPFGWRETRP
jgi:prepilin-type N-terminal cleavage/methylation domain-containing protein